MAIAYIQKDLKLPKICYQHVICNVASIECDGHVMLTTFGVL